MSSLRQQFLQHIAQTSDIPMLLEIERAEGSFLFDTSGKCYLDLIAGISVSVLGHRHPDVVAAIKNQADRYLHTLVYGEYVLSPQVELASLLAAHLPPNLNCVYFTNSGSEATEGAMKLGKRYTGRPEIIACREAYHGSTQGAASLMSPSFFTQGYHPLLPGIRHIDFNSEEDLEKIGPQSACVIVEPVQAEAGVRLPQHGYLKKLRKRCTDMGSLLVFDEIQAGYGRTGSLWAFEQYAVVPDVLLLAKGMGGGMPIGAFIASAEVMQVLGQEPPLGHITTFGGHPVSCAAALATLRFLTENKLWENVQEKEALFHQLLKHPAIQAVRSAGLLMAVEVGEFSLLRKIIAECVANGVITDWFLFNDRSLRIAPPLNISEGEIQMACEVILAAIDKFAAH
ncbi:MAG: aspartate aminotransferase family protein [Saprospiraceae bacterium]|nr:aspartate aminotransferase family protein [Saprospiraceae bacterium]MCF8250845.1 aspartate aminotransferase family protein [Saprospiraceae bacterium]MCF8280696.1 aspartate aminotransferase family protein [Bacteroidales bacterium]MCF8312754.1 aspartate aminotransferase family protein [Saprospiraceae bacterium]MCF8441201.1 aspartate aminotransferase family protein [Saprospiraceae bacterium]